jgi:hypothetical protein
MKLKCFHIDIQNVKQGYTTRAVVHGTTTDYGKLIRT